MKEKKKIVSIALKPSIKDKLKELSEINNYSMSGYLEILIREQWRNYKYPDDPLSSHTLLTNGKDFIDDDEVKEEKPKEKVGGRIRDDRFFS